MAKAILCELCNFIAKIAHPQEKTVKTVYKKSKSVNIYVSPHLSVVPKVVARGRHRSIGVPSDKRKGMTCKKLLFRSKFSSKRFPRASPPLKASLIEVSRIDASPIKRSLGKASVGKLGQNLQIFLRKVVLKICVTFRALNVFL